jgi:hypothetical protein
MPRPASALQCSALLCALLLLGAARPPVVMNPGHQTLGQRVAVRRQPPAESGGQPTFLPRLASSLKHAFEPMGWSCQGPLSIILATLLQHPRPAGMTPRRAARRAKTFCRAGAGAGAGVLDRLSLPSPPSPLPLLAPKTARRLQLPPRAAIAAIAAVAAIVVPQPAPYHVPSPLPLAPLQGNACGHVPKLPEDFAAGLGAPLALRGVHTSQGPFSPRSRCAVQRSCAQQRCDILHGSPINNCDPLPVHHRIIVSPPVRWPFDSAA